MNKQEIRELLAEPLTKYVKEKIANDLEILETLKKYCVGDGWSNGYSIHFWEMNNYELKKIKE